MASDNSNETFIYLQLSPKTGVCMKNDYEESDPKTDYNPNLITRNSVYGISQGTKNKIERVVLLAMLGALCATAGLAYLSHQLSKEKNQTPSSSIKPDISDKVIIETDSTPRKKPSENQLEIQIGGDHK